MSSIPVYRHSVQPEEQTAYIDMNTNGNGNSNIRASNTIAENKKPQSKFRTLVHLRKFQLNKLNYLGSI